MTHCKNCNHVLTGNFCSNCGQPAQLKRIDRHYIVHEIEHLLHFEKGLLYTIRELLLRPEKSVKLFLSENRGRLVKPVIFIIITSLIYTLLVHFFHLTDEYFQVSTGAEAKRPATLAIFNWVQAHYGYANIMMGVFIALWLKLFFRKYDYNLFEMLILLCFVMGMAMLMFAVFVLIQGLTKIDLTQLGGLFGIIYCTWAIGQFFDRKKAMSYVKSAVSYLLGMISFVLACVLVGMLYDAVMH